MAYRINNSIYTGVTLILVTGHQRSGTTLLGKLFFSHPEMAVTHEFSNLMFLNQPLTNYMRAMLAYTNSVKAQFGFLPQIENPRHIRWQNMLFTLRYLYHVMRVTRGVVDFSVIERALHRTFPNKTIVGDKLPQYSKQLHRFAGNDHVTCVVIYRDCRDVASSFLIKTQTDWADQPWVKKWDSTGKIAQRWVERIEHMEKWADQVFLIRYETLVTEPEQVLPQLAAKLNVDSGGFDVNMVDPGSIGNYRKKLTDREVADIMAVAGPTMARLGYV
ncbi:MAG: sulfotransferase [Chloroflexi bacterium]|nr:MAG: sulfotransferase [Chloroflexota bacterium]